MDTTSPTTPTTLTTLTSPTSSASSKRPRPPHYGSLGFLLTLALAGWLGAAAFGLSAHADTAAKPTTQVSYGDLDLSTLAGAQTLLARIDRAANAACGDLIHSPLFPRAAALHNVCVADAVDKAVDRIDALLAARVHKDGRSNTTLAAR